MRYIIIFGVTLIITLLLIFYPQQYLMKFENSITVDYSDITEEDDSWEYSLSNDNIILKEENVDSKWVFIPNKNGVVMLEFKNKNKYKIIYELKVKGNKIIWISGKAYGLLDYPNLY